MSRWNWVAGKLSDLGLEWNPTKFVEFFILRHAAQDLYNILLYKVLWQFYRILLSGARFIGTDEVGSATSTLEDRAYGLSAVVGSGC